MASSAQSNTSIEEQFSMDVPSFYIFEEANEHFAGQFHCEDTGNGGWHYTAEELKTN